MCCRWTTARACDRRGTGGGSRRRGRPETARTHARTHTGRPARARSNIMHGRNSGAAAVESSENRHAAAEGLSFSSLERTTRVPRIRAFVVCTYDDGGRFVRGRRARTRREARSGSREKEMEEKKKTVFVSFCFLARGVYATGSPSPPTPPARTLCRGTRIGIAGEERELNFFAFQNQSRRFDRFTFAVIDFSDGFRRRPRPWFTVNYRLLPGHCPRNTTTVDTRTWWRIRTIDL